MKYVACALMLVTACGFSSRSDGYACETTADCEDGRVCDTHGYCVRATVDETSPDAAMPDGSCPTWYADVDGDGHGDANAPMVACEQPAGTVMVGDDCDDKDKYRFPTAA